MASTKTQRTLHIQGHRLVALPLNERREGIPSILIHGITASPYFWTDHLAAPFSALGPCYALTLPGHYPARFPETMTTETLTAEAVAEVVAGAAEALVGDRPVLLVGHSTGGFAVLAVAALSSVRVQGLISISGFAQGRWTGELGRQQRYVRSGRLGQAYFKTIYRIGRLHPAIFRAALRTFADDAARMYGHDEFDRLIRATYPPYRKLDLEAMAVYFRAMPEIDITRHLHRIAAPTLVLTGNRDPTVPPSQARVIAHHVPNAELVVIPDAGHLPCYEQPQAYEVAVNAWIERTLLP